MTALASISTLPLSLTDRMGMAEKVEMRAELNAYVDFALECEYSVEYSDGKIISMGLASLSHEALVSRIAYLLTHLLGINSEYVVAGSNVPTSIPGYKAIHNADVVVVKGKADFITHAGVRKKMKALANPWMLVEVLSPSTRNFDLGTKTPRYKTMPSVQYILVVDQQKPYAALYSRTQNPGEWLNTETTDIAEGFVKINRRRLRLSDIYRSIIDDAN